MVVLSPKKFFPEVIIKTMTDQKRTPAKQIHILTICYENYEHNYQLWTNLSTDFYGYSIGYGNTF